MKVRIQITVNATFHSQYLQVLNSTTLYDESVDEFLTRHFGIDFAQLFGSALIHGIYAADTRMLSVRATFPVLCRILTELRLLDTTVGVVTLSAGVGNDGEELILSVRARWRDICSRPDALHR